MTKEVSENDVKLSAKLGFMFYGMGGTAIYYFRSYYYLFFLTNVLYLSPSFAGIIIAIGTVWDAVNDLLIGYFVSKHIFKNGEQLKPYSLFMFPLALNTIMMFCDFPVSQKLKGTIALVLYLLVSVFFTFFTTAQNNAALVTKSPQGRIALNTFNSLGTTIGTAIGSLTCLPLLQAMGAMNEQGNLVDGSKFVWAAAIICGISTAGALVYFFFVHESYRSEQSNVDELKFFDAIKYLAKEKLWVNNVLQNLMIALCTSLVTANIAYYATYELHSTKLLTSILAINTICSLLVYPFIGKLNAMLGRNKTLYLSFAILLAGKLIFTVFPHSLFAAYANVVSIGVGTGIGQICLFANRNDIGDIVDEKQHVRVDGMIGTTVTFSLKIATAISSYLSTALLDKAGYDGTLAVQPESALSAIRALMGWIPLVLMVVIILITADRKK